MKNLSDIFHFEHLDAIDVDALLTRCEREGAASSSLNISPINWVQDSLIKTENNDNCDANGRKERMRTPVIAHCNPSPVFNSTKHVFDFVTLFIEGFIIRGQVSFEFSWEVYRA